MASTRPLPDEDIRFPGHWNAIRDDVAVLERYLERTVEFAQSASYQYPLGWTVEFSGEVPRASVEVPEEETLRSAVMAARHFTAQQKNPTLFGSVCNRLRQLTPEKRFHDEIANVRRAWSDLLAKPLKWKDVEVATNGDLFGHYCNGHYFHSDDAFRGFLVRAEQGIGPMFKQQFAQLLFDMLREVIRLGRVVKNALGHDLLAPTPVARRIRAVVESAGATVGPIAIQTWGPPPEARERCGVQCDLQFRMEDPLITGMHPEIHAVLVEEFPGREEYGVLWFTPDDVHRIRYLEPDGLPATRLGGAFTRAIHAVSGFGPSLPLAMEEIGRAAGSAMRSATKRGQPDLASVLGEVAAWAQGCQEDGVITTVEEIHRTRERWNAARDDVGR